MRRRKTKVYLDDVKAMLLDRKNEINEHYRIYCDGCGGFKVVPDEKVTHMAQLLMCEIDRLLRALDMLEVA